MVDNSIQIEESWKNILEEEFKKEYFQNIKKFLLEEMKSGKTIYPEGKNIFNAFNSTPFDNVKVVIIGQDPYHGVGQAHGLCFSVNKGVRIPPSLRNIYKELNSDLGLEIPMHGDLQRWTDQGVLLLNAILTVEAKNPASHGTIGWQDFTDRVIEKISEEREGVIFLLWGSFAQSKKLLIDPDKHFILETTHPSPLSAYRGFLGSKHFSKVNEILSLQGKDEIDWRVD